MVIVIDDFFAPLYLILLDGEQQFLFIFEECSNCLEKGVGEIGYIGIVTRVDGFGVDYIELGWPGSNPKDMECFQKVSELNLKHAKIVAFGATRKKNIKAEEDENLNAIVKSKTSTFPKSSKKKVSGIAVVIKGGSLTGLI